MDQLSMFDLLYPTYQIRTPIRLIELFSGVGAQAMAFRNLGVTFEHYRTCEWEIHAIASYKAIHMPDDNTDYSAGMSDYHVGTILFNLGISADGKKPLTETQIRSSAYGEHWRRTVYNNIVATKNLVNICAAKGEDLGIVETDQYTYVMTYSFPCQDLSLAGKMKGMEKGSGTRSGMLWEVERLLGEIRELPQVLLMENVPQVVSSSNIKHFHSWCDFLENKGYKNYTQILNAKDFGVAQNRERCFMVSILGNYNYRFPQPIPLDKTMEDYLDDEVDEKFYINTEKAEQLIKQFIDNQIVHEGTGFANYNGFERYSDVARCIQSRDYKGFGSGFQTQNAVINKTPVDLTINGPNKKTVSNCITTKDRSISSLKQEGNGVVTEWKKKD